MLGSKKSFDNIIQKHMYNVTIFHGDWQAPGFKCVMCGTVADKAGRTLRQAQEESKKDA
ncbi:hypothetical protein FACS1894172_04230 [Spirochaetia bacterium]|nr:hypothetical protein FACS1894172_04230 [Spirochaetia bacterium]